MVKEIDVVEQVSCDGKSYMALGLYIYIFRRQTDGVCGAGTFILCMQSRVAVRLARLMGVSTPRGSSSKGRKLLSFSDGSSTGPDFSTATTRDWLAELAWIK